MQSNETRPEEKLFEPTVVESDFFILRVRSFEEKYHKTWFEFWTEFKDGSLDDPSNPDYGQWAILCRAYWTELITASGPPLNGFVSDQPERSSGFFII
jgi:hypothetical protein